MLFFRAVPRALRGLVRAPTFTAVVVVILALGIAANTTIFAVMDEVLFHPFPYRDPSRLVMIWESNSSRDGIAAKRGPTAWVNFDAWRNQNHSFAAMEAYQIFLGFNLTGLKTPERVRAARTTPGLFSMLGINAAVGRTFLPGDDDPNASRTVLLTYSFARTHFGDNSPLGRRLLLDGVPNTVIGVLSKEFHLPAIFEGISEYKPDIWVPLPKIAITDAPQTAQLRRLVVCARLKPGISLAQAQADMMAIAERRAKEDPALNQGYGINVFSLADENTDPDLRNDLRILSLAAFVALLLACTNLAGLMLLRAARRRKDMAIMAALGASMRALIAPTMCESFILAAVAGILGFVSSYAGIHIVAALKPSDIHGPERLAVNLQAFLFASCASVLTVFIFGLIPAWLTAHGNLNAMLRSAPVRPSRTSRARTALISVQIAATLALAIAAALLIRSFQRLLEINPGFRPEQVLTAHLSLSPQHYRDRDDQVRFAQQLYTRLRALPGVQETALVDYMPLYTIRLTTFEIEGRPIPQRNSAPSADIAHVTPDFFHAMDIPIRQGRPFTEQDADADPPKVVIVNEALARQFWPGQNPVGTHLRELPINASPGPWQTVIGVVGDFRQFNPETAARPELLGPSKAFSEMSVVLRTAWPDPLTLSSYLQQAVRNIDQDQPISDVQSLTQIVADYNSQRHFNMLGLSAFAGFSMLLTLLGLYGLISAFISSHVRDIGIRLALGAHRKQVCFSLLRPALFPVAAGITLGLAVSLMAKRLIATVLFQISPLDPATYIVIPIALIAILMFTSLSATIRAARIDPLRVLREE